MKDIFAPMKDVFKSFKDVFARLKDVFKSLKDIFATGKDVFKRSKDVFARMKDVFNCSKDVSAPMKDVSKGSIRCRAWFTTPTTVDGVVNHALHDLHTIRSFGRIDLMSTTYEVFPTTEHIPTFRELLSVATDHLNAFLRSNRIERPVSLSARLLANAREPEEIAINLDGKCWWTEENYAWFQVVGVLGGTDAYAHKMASDGYDLGRSILKDEINGSKAEEFADSINRSLEVGRFWSFRRSAGQPAIVNVAYGIVAASLAQLTDGFINSGDGAWGGQLLPARPADFLRVYFRPETTMHDREWVIRCIEALPENLNTASRAV